jgi:hypothetical protein
MLDHELRSSVFVESETNPWIEDLPEKLYQCEEKRIRVSLTFWNMAAAGHDALGHNLMQPFSATE